jgi:hypothetical protein
MMNLLTPTITFQVNLSFLTEEAFMAKPDQTVVASPSPDIYQQNEDVAAAIRPFDKTLRSTWIAGYGNGGAIVVKDGATLVFQGKAALYYKNTYGIGFATDPSRAVLTVVSQVN